MNQPKNVSRRRSTRHKKVNGIVPHPPLATHLGIPSSLAPAFDFEQLSDGGGMIVIHFGDVTYQLKRTRSGRLVLHK